MPKLSPGRFLKDAMDLIAPKVNGVTPDKIIFQFGTEVHKPPHIGTYIVYTMAFVLAQKAQETFNINTEVIFKAHNYGNYNTKNVNGIDYQIDYTHAVSADVRSARLKENYLQYLDYISSTLNIPYTVKHYNKEQEKVSFRSKLIETIKDYDKIKWYLSPKTGALAVRFPCPECYYFDKYGVNTSLISTDEDSFEVKSFCPEHGWYENIVTTTNNTFVNVDIMHRNIIGECVCCDNKNNELHVMVKGLDWQLATYYLDLGLEVYGYKLYDAPLLRIFTPLIVHSNGAKLAKSMMDFYSDEVDPLYRNPISVNSNLNVVNKTLNFCSYIVNDVNSMYRSYTLEELSQHIL